MWKMSGETVTWYEVDKLIVQKMKCPRTKNTKAKIRIQKSTEPGMWHFPVIPGLGKWKQEDQEFKASLYYMRPYCKKLAQRKKGRERKRKISSSMETSSFSCCVRDSVIYSNELTSNTPGPQKFNPCSYCISNVNSSPLCSYTMWNVKFLLLLQENNF